VMVKMRHNIRFELTSGSLRAPTAAQPERSKDMRYN
jgi:hypothetical protein